MDAPSGADGGAAAPRGVLAGFVSTAVLTSSDGLFGDNVEEKRISEAPATRAQDSAGYKPLFEQLQDMKERKDSEWKEKNNPFAPPKALDEEEIAFIRDLEDRQADTERRRQTQHEEDVANFLLAREGAKQTTGPAPPVATVATLGQLQPREKAVVSKKAAPSVVVVRAKRKATQAGTKPKKAKKETEMTAPSVAKAEAEAEAKAESDEKVTAAAPSLGLVAYGSDSDSD